MTPTVGEHTSCGVTTHQLGNLCRRRKTNRTKKKEKKKKTKKEEEEEIKRRIIKKGGGGGGGIVNGATMMVSNAIDMAGREWPAAFYFWPFSFLGCCCCSCCCCCCCCCFFRWRSPLTLASSTSLSRGRRLFSLNWHLVLLILHFLAVHSFFFWLRH